MPGNNGGENIHYHLLLILLLLLMVVMVLGKIVSVDEEWKCNQRLVEHRCKLGIQGFSRKKGG